METQGSQSQEAIAGDILSSFGIHPVKVTETDAGFSATLEGLQSVGVGKGETAEEAIAKLQGIASRASRPDLFNEQ